MPWDIQGQFLRFLGTFSGWSMTAWGPSALPEWDRRCLVAPSRSPLGPRGIRRHMRMEALQTEPSTALAEDCAVRRDAGLGHRTRCPRRGSPFRVNPHPFCSSHWKQRGTISNHRRHRSGRALMPGFPRQDGVVLLPTNRWLTWLAS